MSLKALEKIRYKNRILYQCHYVNAPGLSWVSMQKMMLILHIDIYALMVMVKIKIVNE